MSIAEEKQEIRRRMKQMRSELSIWSFRQNSQTIMNRCMELEEWLGARTVHIYIAALNNEVDTLGLIFRLFDSGKRVVVPKCGDTAHRLQNIRIESLDRLVCGKYGLMEPEYVPEREVAPRNLDLVISPLLAFDRKGERIGFGGGYYDGLLRECICPRIGLAYSFQEVAAVPSEPHDERLDLIITEQEVIRVRHHG